MTLAQYLDGRNRALDLLAHQRRREAMAEPACGPRGVRRWRPEARAWDLALIICVARCCDRYTFDCYVAPRSRERIPLP